MGAATEFYTSTSIQLRATSDRDYFDHSHTHMYINSPQSNGATDFDLYPLPPLPPAEYFQPQPTEQLFPEMDYFAMDSSQFFLDPNFEFDPSLVEFPLDICQAQMQSGEAIDAGSGSQQTKLRSRIRASRACIACRSRLDTLFLSYITYQNGRSRDWEELF